MIRDRVWSACFVACSVALLVPIWVTTYLPLVDLPQHAAQIEIARHWWSAGALYPRYFELNYLTNTFVGYGIAYALSWLVPVVVAVKLVLCLALLGLPLVCWRLIRALGGDRWWVFATFPIAYGYGFMWGFLNFAVAVPIGLWMILIAIRYREAPSIRRAWALLGAALLAFLGHVLVLAYAGLASVAIIWTGTTTWKDRMRGTLALAAIVPLVLAWWLATKATTPGSTPHPAPTILAYGFHRVPMLLASSLGASRLTLKTLLGGLLVVLLPFIVGARPCRTWWRWMPLLAALASYFLIPLNLLDTAFVYPRFSVFVIPAWLMAFDPGARSRMRGVGVGLVLVWMLSTSLRFRAFALECRGAGALLAHIAPNHRLLYLDDDPRSGAVDWFPYLHFGAWYQARYGGIADFSFAEFFPNRFRYQPGKDPPLPYNVEWEPQRFRWGADGGALYDYVLLHRTRTNWGPFAGATKRIELVGEAGSWLLVRQLPPATP